MFEAVTLTKKADSKKESYSGCGTGSDAQRRFSLSCGSGLGKNIIIFGADMNSSVHIDNKKKDTLILGFMLR